MTAMYHIKSRTRNQIMEVFGNFELVSYNTFEAHGELRTRYTVKKPRGSKLYHLIQYPKGTIVVC
jgi:hypothetical protein